MPLVEVSHANEVATITLDSPSNRNALSGALLGELHTAIDTEVGSPGTRVIVLTAAGRTFCAGVDLAEVRTAGTLASAGALAHVLHLLIESPKPTIARVNGHVRGGGMGLVGACDMAVAAADATFAFSEVRVGVAPALIAPAVVPRLEPRAAGRYLLTGETFDAAEAARIGLLTAVADDGDALDPLVTELTDALLEGAPAAQAAAKQVLQRVGRRPPTEEFARMQALSEELFSSAEAQRRIAALLDR